MLTMKKVPFLFSAILIFTLVSITPTYATSGEKLNSPVITPEQARYAILDEIGYGLTFGNDGNAYCHASGSAGAATKFVVRGTLHKYADNGHLDKICNWPNKTTYGQTFIFDEHALMVTPGKYLFTLYVDVYNGTQCENLVFTKTNTK